MVVAAAGIVIKASRHCCGGRHKDLNVRGAFLHMVADGVVSLGVVIAGAAILLTGWSGSIR